MTLSQHLLREIPKIALKWKFWADHRTNKNPKPYDLGASLTQVIRDRRRTHILNTCNLGESLTQVTIDHRRTRTTNLTSRKEGPKTWATNQLTMKDVHPWYTCVSMGGEGWVLTVTHSILVQYYTRVLDNKYKHFKVLRWSLLMRVYTCVNDVGCGFNYLTTIVLFKSVEAT